MKTDTTVASFPHPDTLDDPLTSVLREGARRLRAQAVEAEAEAFLAAMADERLADGRARLVRHGHGPERTIQTGFGPVAVSRVKFATGPGRAIFKWIERGGPPTSPPRRRGFGSNLIEGSAKGELNGDARFRLRS
jgi:hypothetical protein